MPSLSPLLNRAMRCFLAAACLGLASGAASAQASAHKPLRIIVPYPAGGVLDILVRKMGPIMSESMGHPVVVDNRPGGLTNIAMSACAGAPADGSTVCFALEDSMVYNMLLFTKIPYDPSTLAPVIYVAKSLAVIVARSNAPFNNYKELVAFAKSNPGAVNFGTWGPASTPDLNRQWIGKAAGIDMTAVPYRGVVGGTMQGILAGDIDLSVFTIGQILESIKDGKVKPITVLTDERWSGLPNVPTLKELGASPGLTSVWGIYAPPNTPKGQVDRLNAEFVKALNHPATREFMQLHVLEAVGGTPEDLAKILRELRVNTPQKFKALGIQPRDMPS